MIAILKGEKNKCFVRGSNPDITELKKGHTQGATSF